MNLQCQWTFGFLSTRSVNYRGLEIMSENVIARFESGRGRSPEAFINWMPAQTMKGAKRSPSTKVAVWAAPLMTVKIDSIK